MRGQIVVFLKSQPFARCAPLLHSNIHARSTARGCPGDLRQPAADLAHDPSHPMHPFSSAGPHNYSPATSPLRAAARAVPARWPWPTDDRTQYYAACDLVASMGCIAVLERARADGCDWGPSTCSAAARGGHLELLKWARSQGCLWDQQTCAAAARGGHLELLKWARSQGCPWDDRTCEAAATGGHLELLMWARSQGCTWDTHPGMLATCASAAQGGHLELLTWARSQGCPWDTWTRHAHTAHSVRRRSTSHHATQPA